MEGLDVRRSASRGVMQLGWLDARFSFSFGPYYDPRRNGFGPLLALNEDVIQPGTGFEMHPHKDLEIFILPLSGVVEHRDSLGNHAFVRPGEVQKMSAGAGIWHSQMNASASEVDRHLQIWLQPRTLGARPGVDQRRFDRRRRVGRWQALVTPDGRDGSLPVDQEASIHAAILHPEHVLWVPAGHSRSAYIHVIEGAVTADAGRDGIAELAAGDALAVSPAAPVRLFASASDTEVLLFDLPSV